MVGGALATVLSVIVGVTAAYIGGLTDDVLSLVTDIFLVIPAFPLIVVIAAYSKNGGDRYPHRRAGGHGLVLRCPPAPGTGVS